MAVITVSALNRYVKMLLEQDEHLCPVMVSGEISNFVNHYKSGHLYFSLKDENALVKTVMFRTYASRLKFVPENGMKVLVRARVSLYEKDGSFQLYVEDMQPDGVGALQMAYEQLKKKLEAEGLFDASKKQRLPQYPMRVGVITSPTGAAVRDVLNVLGRRFPLANVMFVPVLVQGDGAPPQLVAALEKMNREDAADVIIIGRGGGSLEELWAFNTEEVCRAVAASRIPVISAVGHETDFTLCDFVADMRAPTPSAAAELAVPDCVDLLQGIKQKAARLQVAMSGSLLARKAAFEQVRSKRALSSPLFYIEQTAMRLDYLTRAFAAKAEMALAIAKNRLTANATALDAMSPLKVLSRGYVITQDTKGDVVTKAANLQSGETLSLFMQDGKVLCTVEEVVLKERENDGTEDDI